MFPSCFNRPGISGFVTEFSGFAARTILVGAWSPALAVASYVTIRSQLFPPFAPPFPPQSYAGYHCRKADYRQACKTAFRLWGETLQFTLIQARQKQLREMQEEQKALQEEQRRRSDAEKAAPAMKSKPRKKRGRHGVL
mmetsp:Transcript_23328/g.71456  ORF Transcript_23328/g.71456 Transcript_23328/m.71456 type:complete len:139 (+) Transcript_23328:1383-1799(+)